MVRLAVSSGPILALACRNMSAPLSAAEVAVRWSRPGRPFSHRRVRRWCRKGVFPGAYQVGNRWVIPESAVELCGGSATPNHDLDAYIRQVVDRAPPLTGEQIVVLRPILRPVVDACIQDGQLRASKLGRGWAIPGTAIRDYETGDGLRAECGAEVGIRKRSSTRHPPVILLGSVTPVAQPVSTISVSL